MNEQDKEELIDLLKIAIRQIEGGRYIFAKATIIGALEYFDN